MNTNKSEAERMTGGPECESGECRVFPVESLQKAITTALDAKDRWIARLEHYLERANWRRCDIAACNCNGYHNWNPSRQDIEAEIAEKFETERDRLHAELSQARQLLIDQGAEKQMLQAEVDRLMAELAELSKPRPCIDEERILRADQKYYPETL
jgi:hypothetical protein